MTQPVGSAQTKQENTPASKDPWENAITERRQFLAVEDIARAIEAGGSRTTIWKATLQAIVNRTAEDPAQCAHIALKAKGPKKISRWERRREDLKFLSALASNYAWTQGQLARGRWDLQKVLEAEREAFKFLGCALFIETHLIEAFRDFLQAGVVLTDLTLSGKTPEQQKELWASDEGRYFGLTLRRWEDVAREAVQSL